MDSLRAAFADLKHMLNWLPDGLVGILIYALAAFAALVLHRIYDRVLRRVVAQRSVFLSALLARTQGLTQLAVLLFALIVVWPIAPLDDETQRIVGRLILIGVVVLIGWTAITALHLSADMYLSRLRRFDSDHEMTRQHVTQVRVLSRVADIMIVVFTIGGALMTFDAVRQYGFSLLASAGVAGLVAGLAARPVLGNLFAGVQLAMAQPIRLGDTVTLEGETGEVEEINATYVVLRLGDWRRMVAPLSFFIVRPFTNWTRGDSAMIGTVTLYLDYAAPVAAIRDKARAIVEAHANWTRENFTAAVTDARERVIELRITASAADSGSAWTLRCDLREQLIGFLQREHPDALPRTRVSYDAAEALPAGAPVKRRSAARAKSR
jgi:small-conductance mechanosensitive channel